MKIWLVWLMLIALGLSATTARADSDISGRYHDSPEGLDAFAADTGVQPNYGLTVTGECVWFCRAVRPDTLPATTPDLNAYRMWENAISSNWHVGQTPKRGAILVLSSAVHGTGHVAVVVDVLSSDEIVVWDCNWHLDSKVVKRRVNTSLTNLLGYLYAKDSDTPPILQGGTPTAPSNLQTVAGWENAIDLSWTDNSSDETGFAIERRAEGGSWSQINQVNAGVTTYHNQGYNGTGLALNTRYYYRVKAFNANGPSGFSNELASGTLAPSSDLIATSCFATSIDLVWANHASFADGYAVERQTGAEPWSEIKKVGPSVTTYHDDGYQGGGLALNTLYNYRVRATSGSGRSGPSNQIAAPTLSPPSNLHVVATGATSIDIAWTKSATRATGYVVERRTDTDGWAVIVDNLGPNATSYHDSGWQGQGLASGTRYMYKVRAFYSGSGFLGYSQYSAEVTGQTTGTGSGALSLSVVVVSAGPSAQVKITVQNSGQSSVTGVVLDSIQLGVTPASGVPWTVGDLAAGGTAAKTFTFAVNITGRKALVLSSNGHAGGVLIRLRGRVKP